MKNPCKECIVSPMCMEGCDKLIKHLKESFSSKFYDKQALSVVSSWVRRGVAELYNDDTKWRVTDEDLKRRIREKLK